MSLWEARFKNHELWRTTSEARSAMNALAMPELAGDREVLSYAGMALELVEKRRTESDGGREVTPSMLTSTNNAMQTFAGTLGYIKSGQYTWHQHLTPATDALIESLGSWPPMKIGKYMSGISAAAEHFERRALEGVDTVERRAKDVEDGLELLAAKQTDLAAEVARERQRITEAIAKFTADGDESVKEWKADQEGELATRTQAWDEALDEARREATEHTRQMAEYEAKSRKVLEAVGVNSTATDFGSHAEDQRKAADAWRRVASVVFGLAGVWFIVSSLPSFTEGSDLWESSLARLGVTAAVAGVGAYAARESSQHRRQERESKQVQLVLTALEPFIANLPQGDQNDIRAESARAIFVLKSGDQASEEGGAGPYVDLMKGLLTKIPDRT